MVIADIEAWSDLFVASAGASAALAGLVFVAISINIDDIVRYDGLPDLAIVTIMLLVGVLVVSLFGLIPDQTNHALGVELLVQSLVWTALMARFAVHSLPESHRREQMVSRFALPAFGTVPYVVGAVLLTTGSGSGLYWIFAGLIGAIGAAIINAWVLLVEIRR
jgi:hypothetical protein